MPETTEVPSNIVIEESAPAGVPLRKGEEKHAGMLNLEHQRREDSEIQFLRDRIAKLEGLAVPMRKQADGVSAVRRRQLIAAKVNELKQLTRKVGDRWEGPCAPATLLNFNPVKMRLEGELSDQTVPAAGTGKKVTVPYNGRSFIASYVTFWNAKVWPVIIGTENLEGFDSSSIRPDYISPIGIAYQFYEHYVLKAVGGGVDAIGMGGIVIYEGDVHLLTRKSLEELRVRVPMVDAEASTPSIVVYKSEERSFAQCLADALTKQRQFAEWMISEGHRFGNSQVEAIHNQLTGEHVRWHNYAIDMKYKTEPEKWAVDRLQDGPEVVHVYCGDCRTKQTDSRQYFCSNCNAPFDPLKAFLDGKSVSPDRLAVYEGEDWEKIVAEQQKRNAKKALLEVVVKEPKGKAKD